MRAVVLGGDRRLEVTDKPDPVPGPGDVVVAVERCGICGTDLHLRTSGMLPPGAVLGHELAGTIAARAEDAPDHLAVGRRVAVLPARRCGACDRCRAGQGNLCEQQVTTALGLGLNDGGFAELVRAPAASCHVLPDAVTFDQGALVEPYAVALHALARSRLLSTPGRAPDVSVAIIGAGPIGLLCLAALEWLGVSRIAVAEPSDARRAAAAAMGATVVADARRLRGALGHPPDLVFDAAGAATTPGAALEAVRAGGEIVLLGTVGPGEAVPMPGLLWLVKEVDVHPAVAYTDAEFATAVSQLAAGAVDAGLIVSDVRPLEAAEESFDELGLAGPAVKVLLAPRL
jgi:threonine dehydrogenase-like Zn-dependent dehydrogenase